LQTYGDLGSHDRVLGFESGPDRILVLFSNGDVILYTYESTGIHDVERMKAMARRGEGLGEHARVFVGDRYAWKRRV
jgi:hypothetical protein